VDTVKHILDNTVEASSRGKFVGNYQAAIERGELGATIKLYQWINDDWHPTSGGWYLDTLLDGGVNDSISIDYGQQWNVDSGMTAVINEACRYCAKLYKTEGEE
jgi:hypothetical protein